MEMINTSGRRKCSVARLYMKSGSGAITVNNRDYKEYFPTATLQYKIVQPFLLSDQNQTSFDLKVNVDGGGVNGQAEAIRLAISKAILTFHEEARPQLREQGLLTRDPRMVERKKFGRKKARRRFQFSKR